mmetsp:Transcript_10043/g.26693  ORF Transcript_10043/g.26693 Transcript_10043/m.26693 type:complete len:90 (-) Transcript_10043:10-279(-)
MEPPPCNSGAADGACVGSVGTHRSLSSTGVSEEIQVASTTAMPAAVLSAALTLASTASREACVKRTRGQTFQSPVCSPQDSPGCTHGSN